MTQHETLLMVSPGSLTVNTSIETIEYTEFTQKKDFGQLMLADVCLVATVLPVRSVDFRMRCNLEVS